MLKNIFALGVISILLISCAQYAAPTGGKKDIVPPKLIESFPTNKTLNYKGKEIRLKFDELVESTNLQQELVVTPAIDGVYSVKNKGYEIILKFDKPLRDSATYTFNFANGIKDLTERNPASNLKMVFSTGTTIDSLRIGGNVKYMLTNGKAIETLVGLYRINPKDTLPFYKTKPYYFIKTDTSGNFNLENLRDGNYRVMTFKDRNNNLLFDEKNEEVDFLKDTLKLDKKVDDVQFKISMIDKKGPKMQKNTSRAEDHQITFEEIVVDATLKFTKGDSLPFSIKDKQINIYNIYPQKQDSVFISVLARDSTNNESVNEIKIKFKDFDSKKKKDRNLFFEVKPTSQEKVDVNNQYELIFQSPVKTVNLSKIKLNADSTSSDTLKAEQIKWNKTRTKATIKKQFKTKSFLTLEFEKAAFINVIGDSSVKYNQKNNILKNEDFGSLEGKIVSKIKSQFHLQLITEDFEVIDEQTTTEKFKFLKIKEGTYFVRVINDVDKNKQWSRGDLERNLKAETVYFSKKIKVKANFEVAGFDVNID